ncbi:MAG: L-seryl-tRNA(Sec) selenium transferase [Candidatus Poribacteria bacterium]|nr:L-seryl-tRNA(Sec) selenium transferase [Candidatus Poribacteria bacterium]MDE0506898.1 L-seryl-tRNA(Sec) selenium transferase [Candidatus Poribacteria bacterium]
MHNKSLTAEQKAALRCIPSIERLLTQGPFIALQEEYSRDLVTEILRTVVSESRRRVLDEGTNVGSLDESRYIHLVREKLDELTTSSLRPLVNATGTITHTNLGRALLGESARESLCLVAANYINLEYDLDSGERGHRDRVTEPLLQRLTGCEASTVVNNNAAAVLLTLNTLARGKEVIVSRGELIEIGGSFRIPDVMAASGAILREIGTTNRTHLRDYEEAINDNTGLILKVHPSNYKIVGFSATPDIAEITDLGRRHGVPIVEDLGSGSLIDLTRYGLPREPVVRDRLEAGVEIVTFSGDKLLGGPQGGIIVGTSKLVQRIRKNPLMRALRVGKLTIAALEATLRLYLNEDRLPQGLPMLNCYVRSIEEIQRVAERLVSNLRKIVGESIRISIEDSQVQIGSGTLPVETLPSLAVVLESRQLSAEHLAAKFRAQPTPVIGRTQDGKFWLDVRTIEERQYSWIIKAAERIAVTK